MTPAAKASQQVGCQVLAGRDEWPGWSGVLVVNPRRSDGSEVVLGWQDGWVLTGLDDVNWARLGHAYGSAEDVPGQLRALRSPDEKARELALHDLFGNIFHQGTRYYAYLEGLTPQEGLQLGTWIAVAAYDAVRAGVPLFRALLCAPEPAVRTMAAYTLAWFSADASETLPLLAELVAAEPDETVTATALVAAGLLGGAPIAGAIAEDRPVVRWAATVAGARVLGVDAGQAVVDELLGWTRGDREATLGVPFLDGDLSGYAGLALAEVDPAHAESTFDALLARIPDVTGTRALPVLDEALRLAFPAGPLLEGTPVGELDDRQRRLARVLADNAGPWLIGKSVFANVSVLVRSYGLPHGRAALRAFLADG